MFILTEAFTLPAGEDLDQIHFIVDSTGKVRMFVEVKRADGTTVIYEATES